MNNSTLLPGKLNLPIIAGGLLSVILIWLAVVELQYRLGESARLSATRQAVVIRLEHSLERDPGSFVTDPQAWEHYISNARRLWDLLRTARPSPSSEHPTIAAGATEDESNPTDRLIRLQSEIANLQTELMRIRALKDTIAYRVDALNDSVELILGSLLQNGDNTANTLHVMALKDQLSRYDFTSRTYWLKQTDRQSAVEMLNQQLQAAKSIAADLIDGDHRLIRPGARREMLTVINNLEQLEEHTARFAQASRLFSRMESAQEQIDILGKQLLETYRQGDNTATSATAIPGTLWAILAALPLIWLGISLYPGKERATRQTAGNNKQQPATQPESTRSSVESGDFDPTNLLRALELGAKGNLSHRMDDREPGSRDIAIAYNQMMSTLYRKLIEIHRDAARAAGLLELENKKADGANTDEKPNQMPSSLPSAIELTLELAGISDQLFRKLATAKETPQNAGEAIHSLLTRLDKNQALIRAIIRDHLDQSGGSAAGQKAEQAQTQRLREELQNLMAHLRFFKLDKRL